ncbi:MAG: hypothetical protein SGJ11_00390 [Phycisphaerae bacterium]|nr:hypothetical protein [Phycisphaerae bacterium]
MRREHALADWQRASADAELLAAAAACDAGDVAAVTRLRRRWDATVVAVALDLVAARRKARNKFADADRLLCDPQGVEQATSGGVAAWKARRFASVVHDLPQRAAPRQAIDLCCGIGGDTKELARVVPTIGVDCSEVRAWMTAANAACATRIGEVRDVNVEESVVHIDPARRDEAQGRRRHDPDQYEPPLATCCAIVRAARGGAIKLGPGIDPAVLPSETARPWAIEWISEHGTLVQAVAYTGALVDGSMTPALAARTATMLPEGLTRAGDVVTVPVAAGGDFGAFLLVPDPALERSGLLGGLARELGLAEPARGLGILTTDAAPHGHADEGWFTRYEVLARPRVVEAELRAAIRACSSGPARGVRVRTRGKSADADAWTKALRPEHVEDGERIGRVGGPEELDVFLLRLGSTLRAYVTRRSV